MTRLIFISVLVTVHFVVIQGAKRSLKKIYKPYGSKMCKMLCSESMGYFAYRKEDLSCKPLPSKRLSSADDTRENVLICIKPGNGSASMPNLQTPNRCPKTLKGGKSNTAQKQSLASTKTSRYFRCNTAMIRAIKVGRLCLVQSLLAQGEADINYREKSGRTPVMVAAIKGEATLFNFLVDQGSDMSAVDDYGDSMLHLACLGGNINIVKQLVAANHSMDGRGFRGYVPVMNAVFYGNMNIFNYLVSKGCELAVVDNQNNNILHLACLGGNVNMVERILSMKIFGIDCKGFKGRSPIMMAVLKCRKNVAEFLQRKGCSLTAVDNFGNNLLHIACIGDKDEDNDQYQVEMVFCVISFKLISLESRGFAGRTAVMIAAMKGHLKMFKLLVQKGSSLIAVDDENNSLLHCACKGGNVDIVMYLVELNDISRRPRNNHGQTPLDVAERKGHRRVVALLKKRM